MTVKMHVVMHIFIRPLAVFTLLVLLPVGAAAQSGAPTRTATPSTAAETATIEAGVKLHDAGKFEEAIAKYEEVLKLSPANMTALYELAYSFAANKEYEKSLAAFPHAFLDQPRLHAVFAERDTHEPRVGAEQMMEQRERRRLGCGCAVIAGGNRVRHGSSL